MYGQKSISQSLLDAVNSVTHAEVEEGFKELMQDVKDRAGPQPKGHIGQKAGTRYGGAGQKDDEREKETERLDNKKKAMKKESFGDFKDRLIESLKGNQHKIDKNKNNKIDAHDFKLLRAQKEEVELDEEAMKDCYDCGVREAKKEMKTGISCKSKYEKGTAEYKESLLGYNSVMKNEEVELDEANKESKKDFAARQTRLAAAGKETAKDPERLKRLSSIPGYTAAMDLAKKTTKEEAEHVDEIVYEANIQPTSAKSRSHIGNLSNPVTNSVVHPSSGKEIGLITKQPNGEYHAHHSAAKLSHSQSGTFDNKDKAHQFIRNAHAKAIKSGTLSDRWNKQKKLSQFAKEEVELDEAGEVKAPKGLTVDTLAGPKKAPKGFEKDNEHTSAKVPLKTEEVGHGDEKEDKALLKKMIKKSALKTEGKRPESDTVPFVTDAAQSPKERLRAAFGKVKKEMSNGY